MKKTMKKVMAFALAAFVLFSTVPSFAAEATTDQAKLDKLEDLKVIKGEGNGIDGTKTMTRYRSIVMLLRLLSLEDEMLAFDYEGQDTFADADGQNAYQQRLMAYVKATPELGIVGYPDGTFRPYREVNSQEYAKILLKALSYTEPDDYTWETVATKAEEIGLVSSESEINTTDKFMVLDLAGITYDALTVVSKNEHITLGEKLNYPIVITKLDVKIDTAVALNSKVIEVTLDESAKAVSNIDLKVTQGDTQVAVQDVMLAPWASDNKVLLVTLDENAEAGKLYTITSGNSSANFGGISEDKGKPVVTKVESTDYNEITVTFDEAILADSVMFEATEKYGDSDLAPTFKEYKSKTELVYATADQKDSTLYGTSIAGAADLAGNVMDKDDSHSFVGQSINTVKQSVVNAKTLDSLSIEVEFGVNVDKSSALDASNYMVSEKYGDEELTVTSVAMAQDENDTEIKNKVILTLTTDTKVATLYGLEVKNVGTLYGKELDTDKDEATFTGMAKDEKAPNSVEVETMSNTEIKVSFEYNNVADKLASSVDASLFTVKEKYTDSTLTLAVKEIKDNYIIFTTSSQKSSTLYELKVAKGIVDSKGNATTEELETTFVGQPIATKISSVSATNSAGGKELVVTFDRNYGDGGLDVSSYYIDGGIGYPTKVSAITNEPTKVKLTIKETKLAKIYKLTVKNVKNSDGVNMDSQGLTTNFVGTGSSASLARFEYAIPMNNQAVKLYFDTDVQDLGLLNNDNTISSGVIQYDIDSFGSGTASENFNYGWIDPSNSKVLIAYTTTDNAINDGGSDNKFDVRVTKNTVDATDNKNIVMMAENSNEPTDVKIEGIVAVNDTTLNIYFNQPVRFINPNYSDGSNNAFAYVEMGSNSSFDAANDAEIVNARVLTNDYKKWEISLDKKLAHAQYTLKVTDDAASKISTLVDGTSLVGFDSDATSIVFAGNATEDLYVSGVYAIMTDSRTIKVIYPEAMNVNHVKDISKYTVYDALTGTTDLTNGAIVDATWNSDNNTVMLTTNKDFVAAGDGKGYYLAISNTVKNALGTKSVKKDASTDLRTQFALSNADAAKVIVSSVESDAAGKTITVKFNQTLTTNTNVVAANGTELAKLLDVKINGEDAPTITNVAAKLDSNVVADSTNSFNTLVITVSDTLNVNASGTVDFVSAITNAATGINGESADTDMTAVIFVQK